MVQFERSLWPVCVFCKFCVSLVSTQLIRETVRIVYSAIPAQIRDLEDFGFSILHSSSKIIQDTDEICSPVLVTIRNLPMKLNEFNLRK